MTLDEIWKQYEAYSKSASDSARQLSLAGIAVVWLFKLEKGDTLHLDWMTLVAGTCFVAALACDLLQFISGTLVYFFIGRSRERKPPHKRDGDYPDYVLWPIDIFFVLKFILVMVGYFELLRFLLSRLI